MYEKEQILKKIIIIFDFFKKSKGTRKEYWKNIIINNMSEIISEFGDYNKSLENLGINIPKNNKSSDLLEYWGANGRMV